MFSRKHRCADCGFLAAAHVRVTAEEVSASGARRSRTLSFEWLDEPATLFVRRRPIERGVSEMGESPKQVYGCHLHVTDPEQEIGHSDLDDPLAWNRMIGRLRSCAYFERFQPMLSFREHLDLKLRRRERFWAAGGVLAGIVLTAAADVIVRLVV